jgi:hypothetical protein
MQPGCNNITLYKNNNKLYYIIIYIYCMNASFHIDLFPRDSVLSINLLAKCRLFLYLYLQWVQQR